MDIATIRSLYSYHDWVNDRLLKAAESIPAEQTRDRFGASFDSIHNTLAHIMGAQIVWLSRWKGVTPDGLPGGDDFESIGAIHRHWDGARADLWEFIDSLTDEKLNAVIEYKNLAGEAARLPLWQMMTHVINHATHHRSELADMLTRAGSPPPSTDMHIFFLEQAG